MQINLLEIQEIFFIGVAGTGMSALAQYAAGIGKTVSGSDRYFVNNEPNDTKEKLTAAGVQCFPQDGSGISNNTQLVVISTAVEATNAELQKAKSLGILVVKRADLLASFCASKRTVAIGGTSGKSTTSAMLFDILSYAGMQPSIISGAGLVRLQQQGLIGNAWVGKGDWLVIEADESDGSIVNYHPEIGVLLNIDKDHKEIDELLPIFQLFKNHSKQFFVNTGNVLAASFSDNTTTNFSEDTQDKGVHYTATVFEQNGFEMQFIINEIPFQLQALGKHNMENVLAAASVANSIGVSLQTIATGVAAYKGIYRRNQIIGKKNGVWLIDDYAHNPAKVAAAIRGVQPLAAKVIAWFQPHGYGPTRFLRNDFVQEISNALRPEDEIWMSEIYYAGGTAVKDISAADLIADLIAKNANAYFVENRNDLVKTLQNHFTNDTVLLLMGARDPSLDSFATQVYSEL